MKFKIPVLDDAIEIKKATILTIERQDIFSDTVKSIYCDENNKIKFFHSNFETANSTELMIVTDILGYDINTSNILKMIHTDLVEQLNDKPEVKNTIEKFVIKITDLIAYECLEQELSLIYDEITILELIKALGIKIESRGKTIFEKCFEIIQIFKYLNKKKVLIFINISVYFSREELQRIIEYISLSCVNVLFIEPRKVYDFPQYVLDEDYFIMFENML